MNSSANETSEWNAEDYAKNSSAQRTWADELIAKLTLAGDESVLDIGCGDGKITHEIALRLPNGSVLGVDSSENMITLAAQSFAGANLSFRVMDAADIRLDRMFDVAFSNAALHWVRDHQAVLKGLRKHLNPNAKILLQMGGRGNAAGMIAVLEQIIAGENWRAFFEDFKLPYYFYAIEDYERWLPSTGYEVVRLELIPKDMIHDGREGLEGWLRTTWFPYTDELPFEKRGEFLTEWVDRYLEQHPLDAQGRTHVGMVRLEVEARTI